MEDGGGLLRGPLGGLERPSTTTTEEPLADRGRSLSGTHLGAHDAGGRGSDGEEPQDPSLYGGNGRGP